jgi:hypothetical protein
MCYGERAFVEDEEDAVVTVPTKSDVITPCVTENPGIFESQKERPMSDRALAACIAKASLHLLLLNTFPHQKFTSLQNHHDQGPWPLFSKIA